MLMQAHKISIEKGARIYRLVTQNTIEDAFHQLIEKKMKRLKDNSMGTEDSFHLTREELAKLLKHGTNLLLEDQKKCR